MKKILIKRSGHIKCDLCDWSVAVSRLSMRELKTWYNAPCPICHKGIIITSRDLWLYRLFLVEAWFHTFILRITFNMFPTTRIHIDTSRRLISPQDKSDANDLHMELDSFMEFKKTILDIAARYKWISVKDRLPLDDSFVLVCNTGAYYSNKTPVRKEVYPLVAYKSTDDEGWYWVNALTDDPLDFDGEYAPTHWMPLPALPQ